jgi:hypothetical protein
MSGSDSVSASADEEEQEQSLAEGSPAGGKLEARRQARLSAERWVGPARSCPPRHRHAF